MGLKDKVIITGVRRGFGKMYAMALIQQIGKLAVIEVNSKDARQGSRERKAKGKEYIQFYQIQEYVHREIIEINEHFV